MRLDNEAVSVDMYPAMVIQKGRKSRVQKSSIKMANHLGYQMILRRYRKKA